MRLFIVAVLCNLIFATLWPGESYAHVFPNHSEPRVGATVAAPPYVRIWFDGAIEPAFSTLSVQNASGQRMDRGDSRVNPSDATLLEVSLPPLSSGTYRVIWRVVARDGHKTEGDFTFTVK